MLIRPDANSLTGYELNRFPSAKAAECFFDSSLHGRAPKGSAMFWALTVEPTTDVPAELLVLIRDSDSPVVYPVSFADIKSAFEFVQLEMTRGLSVSQVMIYWAVPAHAEIDFRGHSTIFPSAPLGRAADGRLISAEDAAIRARHNKD